MRMEDASGTDRVRCGEIGFSESSLPGSGFRRGRKTQGEDFRTGPGLFRTLMSPVSMAEGTLSLPRLTTILPRNKRLIKPPRHPVRWLSRRRPHLLN